MLASPRGNFIAVAWLDKSLSLGPESRFLTLLGCCLAGSFDIRLLGDYFVSTSLVTSTEPTSDFLHIGKVNFDLRTSPVESVLTLTCCQFRVTFPGHEPRPFSF